MNLLLLIYFVEKHSRNFNVLCKISLFIKKINFFSLILDIFIKYDIKRNILFELHLEKFIQLARCLTCLKAAKIFYFFREFRKIHRFYDTLNSMIY